MRHTIFAIAMLFATPLLAANSQPVAVPSAPAVTYQWPFAQPYAFGGAVQGTQSHVMLPPEVRAQLNAAGPWGAYIQQYLSQFPVDPNPTPQSDAPAYDPGTVNYSDTSDIQNQIATQDMINNQMMLNNEQDALNTQNFINTENMVNNMQDMVNTQNAVNEQNMINSMQ